MHCLFSSKEEKMVKISRLQEQPLYQGFIHIPFMTKYFLIPVSRTFAVHTN